MREETQVEIRERAVILQLSPSTPSDLISLPMSCLLALETTSIHPGHSAPLGYPRSVPYTAPSFASTRDGSNTSRAAYIGSEATSDDTSGLGTG